MAQLAAQSNDDNAAELEKLNKKLKQYQQTLKDVELAMPMLERMRMQADNDEDEEEVAKIDNRIKLKNQDKEEGIDLFSRCACLYLFTHSLTFGWTVDIISKSKDQANHSSDRETTGTVTRYNLSIG